MMMITSNMLKGMPNATSSSRGVLLKQREFALPLNSKIFRLGTSIMKLSKSLQQTIDTCSSNGLESYNLKIKGNKTLKTFKVGRRVEFTIIKFQVL